MMILLDTSVLIDHLRGNAGARDALTGAVSDGHRLAASVVVKVEVLAGMRSVDVDPVDYIIAATATAHDTSLWTRNIKHFPMFDGLTSPY